MKKKIGFTRVTAMAMAGMMLMTGCGGSGKSDSAPAQDTAAPEPAKDSTSGGYDNTDITEDVAEEWSDGYADTAESAAATDEGMDYVYNTYEEKSAGMSDSYLDSCYDDWAPGYYDNNEEYSEWDEKGFSSVMKEPLSTFAADVDTASYSNLRRLINDGYMLEDLPDGAVRTEEMINYFSYDYNAPKGKEPFGVTTQISSCPWNDEAELLMIGLQTEEIDYSHAPAANLVFLLDVSGSMFSDDKLPLLQESFGLRIHRDICGRGSGSAGGSAR